MSMNLRFKWLACWTVSALLLGACVGTEEETGQDGVDPKGVEVQAQDPAAGDVTVQISTGKTIVRAGERVALEVTLTNNTTRAVRLLAWYAPDTELEEPLFQVTREGKPVEFIGPHYKRPAPVQSDYITLPPGKSVKRTVELSGFYDLSKTGDYQIRYSVKLKEAGGAVSLESKDVTMWIEGRASSPPQAVPDTTSITSSLAFSKCTTDQQGIVTQAVGSSSAMANDANVYLSGVPAANPRYTTWFGQFSTSGWNTAKSHFVAIKDALDTKPLTFDCGCKKKYYAYVYPNQPYNIYLCSVFWSAPLSGTDSKGGTIIHEMSHFTVVAGTDDWVYGQTNAKALAISDPTKALNNADSHEYFGENTPFQQ